MTSTAQNIKTITKDDIEVICSKCNKKFTASKENCPFCNPPPKETKLEEIKPSGPVITEWKTGEEYKVSLQIIDALKPFKSIKAEIRDVDGARCLQLRGLKKKYVFFKTDGKECYFFNNKDSLAKMRKILEDIPKFKDIMIQGHNSYKISQLMFLTSSLFRENVYDFEANAWNPNIITHCPRKAANSVKVGGSISGMILAGLSIIALF